MNAFLNKVEYAKRLGDNQFLLSKELFETIKCQLKSLQQSNRALTDKDRRLMKRYELISEDGGLEYLICKRKPPDYKKLLVVAVDEAYDIIHSEHIESGHCGLHETQRRLRKKYANIPRQAVLTYLSNCEFCTGKRQKKPKIDNQTRTSRKPWNRVCSLLQGHVTLVEFAPISSSSASSSAATATATASASTIINNEEEQCLMNNNCYFKWILIYKNLTTKFTVLRPVQSDQPIDVAQQLINIFCEHGSPMTLHCDREAEYFSALLQEITISWPALCISQGTSKFMDVASINTTILKERIICWMQMRNTLEWSEALKFVQWEMNFGTNATLWEALCGRQAADRRALEMKEQADNNADLQKNDKIINNLGIHL